MELIVYSNRKEWKKKGGNRINSVHYRNHDLPSIVYFDGERYWFDKNGQIHREKDLSAIISSYGYKCWYRQGKCHREKDLPAIIYSRGEKYWYIRGVSIK
jgi:hypothetical protein